MNSHTMILRCWEFCVSIGTLQHLAAEIDGHEVGAGEPSEYLKAARTYLQQERDRMQAVLYAARKGAINGS